MATRETVTVLRRSTGGEPSSGATRMRMVTRGLSLIVMPVSVTSTIVPTALTPPAISSLAMTCLRAPTRASATPPQMEIIDALEASPRGAYCGAIGRLAPDGSAAFNVAIRTLTLQDGAKTARLGLGDR